MAPAGAALCAAGGDLRLRWARWPPEVLERLILSLFDDVRDQVLGTVMRSPDDWLQEGSGVRLSLHPAEPTLAVGRGRTLALVRRAPGAEDAAAGESEHASVALHQLPAALGASAVSSGEVLTALCWIVLAAPPTRTGAPAAAEDACLAVGTSAGRLRLLSPQTGELLLSQRLHVGGAGLGSGAVMALTCRSARAGASADDPAEDLTIAFAGGFLARVDGWELRSALRRGRLALLRGERPAPLAVTKWELPIAGLSPLAGLCAGVAPPSLRELLTAGDGRAGGGSGRAGGPAAGGMGPAGGARTFHLVTSAGAGEPLLAVLSGSEAEAGALAVVAQAASRAGAAVANFFGASLRAAAGLARGSPARGVIATTAGPSDAAAISADSRGGDVSTAATVDPDDVGEPRAAAARGRRAGPVGALTDVGRGLRALAWAPRGALLATADTLGRVCMLDAAPGGPLAVVRMWKGNREALMGWYEAPLAAPAAAAADAAAAAAAAVPVASARAVVRGVGPVDVEETGGGPLRLAILAPRRRRLEVWAAPHGGRLAAWALPSGASPGAFVLLEPPAVLGAATGAPPARQRLCVLEAASGCVWELLV